MSFDISRSSFRPRRNFLGVVMQQGRVQLDSDWNEWQDEYSRRIQAGTLDTIGQAVYPASTPNAFKITAGTNASGNTLYIGAGRYYVDGLLAENHGPETEAAWDDSLGEMSGAPAFATTGTAQTDYTQQPYLPNAQLPAAGSVCIAYLDVWQRDVTYLEDPWLIDPAVNIDTTGRRQTVWQVKLLNLGTSGTTPDCSTDIPSFDALSAPPAGRLTSGLVPNAASGPCCLSPNTGFTGQENQLYRVEIHTGGTPGAIPAAGYGSAALSGGIPTFKFSRDDASVQTSVSAIASVSTSSGAVSQLTVASLGRDQVLGFAVNDWIEITDDVYELNGEPGEIYQITGVTAATNTITLSGSVSSHFPLNGGQTTPDLHTRITRWDQQGQIYSTDSSGNLTPWYDLAAGSSGVIPIPPTGSSGLVLVLENGVTISFDLSPEPTSANETGFRTGDYWLFSARAANGTVETLTAAPPLGINHHYAKLGVVTFPTVPSDCRLEWPPSASGSSCCCSVTISPSTLTGDVSLQSILSSYQGLSTSVTICLEPGTYALPSPLYLTSGFSNITLEACQPGTVILQALAGNEAQFNDGLIVLDNCATITLSGLTLQVPLSLYSATTFAGLTPTALPTSVASMVASLYVSVGIRVVGGEDISIQDCNFQLGKSSASINDNSAVFAAGVLLNGSTTGLQVQNCEFQAANSDFYKTAQLRSRGFFTGVAMASAVSFTTPAASVPGAPTNVSGVAENVSAAPAIGASKAAPAAKMQAKLAVQTEAAKTNVGNTEATLAGVNKTGVESTLAGVNLAPNQGLQNIGGVLQNIFSFGNNSSTALAAQGGTVLPASLDNAVITGNTFRNLTSAALLMGEAGALEASDNQVQCIAGFWVLAPSQTQTLLNDPRSLALVGATVALGMPLPQNDSSSPVTVPAASPSVFLYTGTSASGYQDSNGNTWLPDTTSAVQNVTIAISPAPGPSTDWPYAPSPAPTISGTSDPTLYQTERAGPSFSYTLSGLNSGFYTVTLDFAEIYYTQSPDSGIRVFDVSINNEQVLTNFDIGAEVGPLSALQETFTNIPSSNGQIVVQLTGTNNGSDHNAKINALSVVSVSSGAPFLGSGNESDSTLFFDQLAQVAWQGYSSTSLQARWRFDANEMQGLSASAILLLDDDNLFNDNSGSLMLNGNRIDGEIQEQNYTDAALTTDQAVAARSQTAARPQIARRSLINTQTAAKASLNLQSDIFTHEPASVFEYYVNYFYSLISVSAVSRAVISSNMVSSGSVADGFYGECLIVSNSTVTQAFVTIMSNLFAGYIDVPLRNLNDTTLDYTLQSWEFLNTTV